ncbi:hypothetical protein X760_01445 [Mesorhizobium sp. LSHC422A00]|nr:MULTISPECIES: hypothetical protein [unclassified Mesorhizobium]ESW82281.1 hypothetical protein X773_12870 [Mesorhizobium sp. LSJC285A00]ESX63554.1 hypothetical protein X760_01445 [Mesorhizobium sp. LSHC422A00]ESZ09366.1 hypothetical protein X736_06160 [Mesorhizobium sp. L2C089B000]ESZ42918.1 hypothetical protein X732_02290 [Mesorhizobium sp. L2C066B000]WJI53952.1 hypothetical protein NLY44_15505 [Mesorhizobium sp. C089B]
MPKTYLSLTLAAAWLASPLAHADGVDRALDAFHATCLAHGPDFERTATLAKTRGWTPLVDGAALAPVDAMKAFRGWQVTGDDLPAGTMVAVTRATMDGRSVQTCSLKLFDVDRAEFEKRFFHRTDAEKIGEERKGRQVSRLFILIAGNRKQLVHLTSPAVRSTANAIIASSIVDD